MRIKPEHKLTVADHQLIRTYVHNRSLQRRKRLHPNLAAKLERMLPQLEAEAESRGLSVYLAQWREYPTGAITFGHRVMPTKGPRIENVPPTTEKRRRRRRHESQSPSPADAGAMLTDLERQLAASIDRARSTASDRPQNVSPDPLTDSHLYSNLYTSQSSNAGQPRKEGSMSPTTTKPHRLVVAHKEAIEKYANATTPGVKAGSAKAIRTLELDMTLEGIEFEPWQRPQRPRKGGIEMTEEQLLGEVSKLRALIADDSIAESIKGTADARLQRRLAEAERRGIEVPA